MTKVISISDEAYEELKKLKNGMSFSEVIVSITKEKKKSIMDFAGILTNEEAEKMIDEVKKFRKMKSWRIK